MEPSRADDSRDLAGFGYRQELDRTLGGFSSFAAGFSYISILTGLFQTFYLGYGAGGAVRPRSFSSGESISRRIAANRGSERSVRYSGK